MKMQTTAADYSRILKQGTAAKSFTKPSVSS